MIRNLDVGGSAVGSGLIRPVGASCRRVCFNDEPSAMSGNVRFGGGKPGNDADVLVL